MFKKRTLRTAHILIFWLVAGLPGTAETSELPTIDRHGDHATLTVDAFRPLLEIATAFDISAEDPFYMFTGDAENTRETQENPKVLRQVIASMRIANVSDLADISSYRVEAMEAANPMAGTAASAM